MDRRQIIKAGGILCVSAVVPVGCYSDTTVIAPEINEVWERIAKGLENAGIYSREDHPEMSEEELELHLPVVEFGYGSVSVKSKHPMEEGHWINTLYIKDQSEAVIGLKQFKPEDDLAWSVFPVPIGTKKILAFAFCTVHDHWCEKVSAPHT